MRTTHLRLGLLVGLVILMLLLAASSHAQEAPACPPEVACAQITLTPATLLGDFFLNDQLLAAGQNNPILQIPSAQNLQIVVRNIQSPGEVGFNELFVYQETSVSVNVRAGQVRNFNARPRQEFIRGTLAHTCDPRARRDGEEVLCQIIVDGVDKGVFPPGESTQFILDPGPRIVRVQLVGGSATLWEPTAKEQTVTITAGRTATLRTNFDKRARLVVTLSEPGVVGDIFVNEVQIASQAPNAELFVAPGIAQVVVVRNMNPAPSVDFRWKEATQSVTLSASQDRTITLRLQQESLIPPEQRAAQERLLRDMVIVLFEGFDIWLDVADIWIDTFGNPTIGACPGFPTVPTLPTADPAILAANPVYQEAYTYLDYAFKDLTYSIETFRYQCSNRATVPLDYAAYISGLQTTNHAYDMLELAEDRLATLAGVD